MHELWTSTISRPGVAPSTMNNACSSPAHASARKNVARHRPSRTTSRRLAPSHYRSRAAVVSMHATSEPADWGSVIAQAVLASPRITGST